MDEKGLGLPLSICVCSPRLITRCLRRLPMRLSNARSAFGFAAPSGCNPGPSDLTEGYGENVAQHSRNP
jgi:hypothetical protein